MNYWRHRIRHHILGPRSDKLQFLYDVVNLKSSKDYVDECKSWRMKELFLKYEDYKLPRHVMPVKMDKLRTLLETLDYYDEHQLALILVSGNSEEFNIEDETAICLYLIRHLQSQFESSAKLEDLKPGDKIDRKECMVRCMTRFAWLHKALGFPGLEANANASKEIRRLYRMKKKSKFKKFMERFKRRSDEDIAQFDLELYERLMFDQ